MTQTLHARSRPFVAPRARCMATEDAVVIETTELEMAFADELGALLVRAWPAFDGSRRVVEVADAVGVSARQLLAILEPLCEEQLVLDASRLDEAPSELFVDAYMDECEFWVKEIFAQPFWGTVLSGSASASVVLGWGIEFYHYVCAANEHMATSVAYCRDASVIRGWLADHYVEEADHGEILLEGLARTLDRARVSSAPPLPSTRALVNYLSELAISNTIAYAATFGVMQQGRAPKTREAIDRFYAELTMLYPFAAGLFDGLRRHALIDVELEHEKLVFEQICGYRRQLPEETRRSVARAVRDVSEHFILFFEGILDFYSRPGVLLPRRMLNFSTVA